MKATFLALMALLCLSACGPHCPSLPQPTALPDSPLRQFRLSGVLVDAAPAATAEDVVGDSNISSRDKGFHLRTISKLIHASFKQPGQEGYDSAQAIRVKCEVDSMRAGTIVFFANTPATFSARLTLIDPNTGKQVFSKHYSKVQEFSIGESSFACADMATGVKAFQIAVNDCLREFGNDIRGVRFPKQETENALIDGTLVIAESEFPWTKSNLKKLFSKNGYEGIQNNTMRRIASTQLTNEIQSRVFSSTIFSNSARDEYNIKVFITDYSYSLWRGENNGSYSYSSDNAIFKNGKEIASFPYNQAKCSLMEQDAAIAKHSQAVLDYLRANAQTLQQK